MSSADRRRRRLGLTLLEVLAAVAILGIVYTLLADWAIQGLIAEGEARRRLDASLLADAALAEIEAGLEGAGAAPEQGVSETEQGEFLVKVEVSPLDLGSAGLSLETPEILRRERDEDDERDEDEGADAVPSFVASSRQTPSALQRIDITVTWTEATRDLEVTRTTFAFDRESVRPLLDQLDAQAVADAQAGTVAVPQSGVDGRGKAVK